MRPTSNRLSTLLSARHCRSTQRIPELGLEVFRNDWASLGSPVETDEPVSRRTSRALRASPPSLSSRKYLVFLRRELWDQVGPLQSDKSFSGKSRRGSGGIAARKPRPGSPGENRSCARRHRSSA